MSGRRLKYVRHYAHRFHKVCLPNPCQAGTLKNLPGKAGVWIGWAGRNFCASMGSYILTKSYDYARIRLRILMKSYDYTRIRSRILTKSCDYARIRCRILVISKNQVSLQVGDPLHQSYSEKRFYFSQKIALL
jgi:hypothetical protein